MHDPQYKELWAAGTEAGIRSLLDRIIDSVRQLYGSTAAITETGNRIRINWGPSSKPFVLEYEPTEFWIHAPSAPIDQESASWNNNLEGFYQQVIEPISDVTGGVATGIGYNSLNHA